MAEEPEIPTQATNEGKFNFDLKFQELLYNHLKAEAQYREENNQPARFNALCGLRTLMDTIRKKPRRKRQKELQAKIYPKILAMRKIILNFSSKIVYDPGIMDYVTVKDYKGSDYIDEDEHIIKIPNQFQEIRLDLDIVMDNWVEELTSDLKEVTLIFVKAKPKGAGADE